MQGRACPEGTRCRGCGLDDSSGGPDSSLRPPTSETLNAMGSNKESKVKRVKWNSSSANPITIHFPFVDLAQPPDPAFATLTVSVSRDGDQVPLGDHGRC